MNKFPPVGPLQPDEYFAICPKCNFRTSSSDKSKVPVLCPKCGAILKVIKLRKHLT